MLSVRIKGLRKEAGLSQEQLAEKIGVSRQAVTKWETGLGLPDLDNLVDRDRKLLQCDHGLSFARHPKEGERVQLAHL